MAKTLLSTLNITTRPIQNATDPVILRQNKLIMRLEEQREIARGLLENEIVHIYKEKFVCDGHGNKSKVTVPKKVKPWFYSVKGLYFLELRYGSKALELLNGKYAISVGAKAQLLAVIDTVIDAVKAGELDLQLENIKRPVNNAVRTKNTKIEQGAT
ncbi:hypothetical protein AEA42_04410 [Shewanella sp. Sh95]|uniref:DUF6641 family protein n=1 Tax=Shewanella sp. Sh95 TaxID=1689868 RepID=UPI0006DB861E|nr:DUF6641 family protein [Shewanella sp. Sh95]KPN78205.1 hypothetical protein AEA42_04410 [Shewanella sp. Sh95]